MKWKKNQKKQNVNRRLGGRRKDMDLIFVSSVSERRRMHCSSAVSARCNSLSSSLCMVALKKKKTASKKWEKRKRQGQVLERKKLICGVVRSDNKNLL